MRVTRRRRVVLPVLAFLLAAAAFASGDFLPELRRPPEGGEAPPLPSVLTGTAGRGDVKTAGQWAKDVRPAVLKRWRQIIGPFPDRVPLETEVLSTETLDDHTRLLVRYRSDPRYTSEAYLLVPRGAGAGDKRPGVVVLHQTSDTNLRDPVGLAGRETMHMALHLVRRGYVCVAPRNFLWGLDGKTYQAATDEVLKHEPWKTGMAKMTWDAIRATDVLAERPEVDAGRLGTIGHSLGGKEALYHAAFDERIKAAVSCEGGVGLGFSNWDADWYLGKQIKAKDFRHDHHELIALIAPRALLVIGGESADGKQSWPYIAANLPLWRLLGAEDRLGLLRHKHGHDFPPPGEERELVYRWLDRWVDQRAGG